MDIYGRTYLTAAEIVARIGELTIANHLIGESDDRLTEINCLIDALKGAMNDREVPDVSMAVDRMASSARISVSIPDGLVLPLEQSLDIAASPMDANRVPFGGWVTTK